MRTLRSPLHMNECLPPEYGPSQPRALKRPMSSRREMGLGMLGDVIEVATIHHGQGVAALQRQNDPFLQHFAQLCATSLQVPSFTPDAGSERYAAEVVSRLG